MSSITLRKNTTKAAIDRAIHAALKSAAGHSRTSTAFERLLRHVRRRSILLRPARPGGRSDVRSHCDVVEALLSLAFHSQHWLRPLEAWGPTAGNPLRQFSSLARYLLAHYPVPAFMTSVWFRGQSPQARRQQAWFTHLGMGWNIRKADIPLPYTKMMAHHFVQAPDHFTAEMALRWGQIRGLGGSEGLAHVIAATRLGRAFEHEDFWGTVVQFCAKHPTLDLVQVGPIVDYLHHQKFAPQENFIEGDERLAPGPPQPGLSMKGRTPRSLLRQVAEWHKRLGHARKVVALRWPRSDIGEFRHVEQDDGQGFRCWTIRELLTGGELHREGEAMRHCVGAYVQDCARRETLIWALRFEDRERRYRVLTIEVDPATRTICQARRRGNTPPNAKVRSVVERWAQQEGLTFAECL